MDFRHNKEMRFECWASYMTVKIASDHINNTDHLYGAYTTKLLSVWHSILTLGSIQLKLSVLGSYIHTYIHNFFFIYKLIKLG